MRHKQEANMAPKADNSAQGKDQQLTEEQIAEFKEGACMQPK